MIAAFLAAARQPTPRRVAALAVCAALQASTLGADVLVQTAVAGIVLLDEPAALRDRRLLRLAGSGVVALLLAAPALLGARALMAGTAREQGFVKAQVLSFSLHPAVLGEMLLPKFLGDPHAFSDADYWGRAYFPEGNPYLVSIYLGLPVLLLAWLGVVLALRVDAGAVREALAAVLPPLADPRGLVAARSLWPDAWLSSAALSVAAGLALAHGGAWARTAALVVALDLSIVNGGINPLAPVLKAMTPPGFLVVLDGHYPDWKAEDRSGPVPLKVAFGRYQAVPTRGGEAVVTFRYRPAWRAPALFLLAIGGLAVLVLVLRR